ncbi:hypothetical protein ONZ51_g1056 [Trametes cubensis]|uniref:Uncharacterized protein n=1 Tax=Trametes cubensis TaxID=1111947 RepID=A0AAD7XFU6_9APHY|nr:hypothetical protein ONZ51_g1056 [Trametes cubensis]
MANPSTSSSGSRSSATAARLTPHQWIPISVGTTGSSSSDRTFARALGLTEASFYYDRIFNGTADIVWQYTVQVAGGHAQGAALFSEMNVARTWAALKRYYPLLGSRMQLEDDNETIAFIVQERALFEHQPGEVTLGTASSQDEITSLVWRLIRDKPMEYNHIMARVLAFKREDMPGAYSVLFKAAHAVTDGISGAILARTFFDVLCAPPFTIPPLEERLAMARPSDALSPTMKMSPARQRWRRAIGKVTFLNRRNKLAGGHTIPRKDTVTTYCTPSATDTVLKRIDIAESRAILDACRRHKVTFGAAIPVISQMALTRFLHRRFLRGDLTLDDWEHRRRQPMHYGGPLNLRPYLDEAWQRAGGRDGDLAHDRLLRLLAAIHARPVWCAQGRGRAPRGGRVRSIRTQLVRTLKHPLLPEIAYARQPLYVLRKKMIAAHWEAMSKGEPLPEFPELTKLDAAPSDFVFTGGVSSVGDMSLIMPSNYPLPQDHPLSIRHRHTLNPRLSTIGSDAATTDAQPQPSAPPKLPTTSAADAVLQMVNNSTHLHSRPSEFFLGNGTTRGHLELFLTFDANVHSRLDVEEYMQDCYEAAMYYFGGQDVAPTKGKL